MTTDDNTQAAAAPATQQRRWPRYVAIGVGATGVLLAGAYWYLGRETTLQMIAQRVASASGGSIVITGVSGSLYGAMHMDQVVYRSPDQLITARNLDINWSPWQYLSSGIAISKLHVASLQVETLRASTEPATMPVSLAPPFTLSIGDGRVAKLILTNAGANTVIDDLRFKVEGNQQRWDLRDASALTPWGKAAANGTIAATRPFKLDLAASLLQTRVEAGQAPARLSVRVGGDLALTQINAAGQAGKAVGDMKLTLAPFEPVPLRALNLKGRNINPGFFNPALPAADLSMTIDAAISPAKAISGSVNIVNAGDTGPLDKQLLPLQAMRARLGGTLEAMQINDVLVDLGAAGKLAGGGALQRGPDEEGIGSAQFKLHTDALNLKALYSTMKQTAIAGDVQLTSTGEVQTLGAQLSDRGMRLDAQATLADQLIDIKRVRLTAGNGHVELAGSASLADKRAFKVGATAVRFNPAALGDFPDGDINAQVNASGAMAPEWNIVSDFTLRPSRLFGQPLSGKGKFAADPKHVTGVEARFAMGSNKVDLRGSFGAPGETLKWTLDAPQLSALSSNLNGALAANGVINGTMEAPRTTFVANARGLGMAGNGRKANDSVLQAAGEAWLAGGEVNIKTSGTARSFNPAAFGSPLAGSINGKFDASGRLGAIPSGSVALVLDKSTLSNAPLWGHARLSGSAQRIASADVDLHVGPNVIAANGKFGSPSDRLEWRIDAPQLAVLGGDYGGVLRGSGTLSGTAGAPALTAALEGQNLKLPGAHQVKALRASANIGAGQGGSTPMLSNVEITGYSSGDTRVDSVRLQTSGTRSAHTISLAARGDAFNAAVEARGGWNGDAWTGTLATLKNSGRYAFTLANPVPLRLGVAPGAGALGLMKPQQIAFNGALVALPAGTINIASLTKNGPRWSSKGAANGVPLNYLAQFSPSLRETMRGDLTLGGEWGLDLTAASAAGGAPQLSGTVHVFREKGDLIVGADAPVVLGLSTLDLRADVAGNALRTRVNIEGAKAGVARIDATTELVDGMLGTSSPLRLSANADMASIAWMSPLTGQPGLELGGSMKLDLTGAGTIGAPTLNGTVSGDKLAVRWPEQGVRLRNGELRAQLTGDQLVLQRLRFDGRQGNAQASGMVRFAGGEATMQLKLVADKLEALSRPDRTVVVSGTGTVNRTADSFNVDGKFRVDRALLELAPQGRPTMSEDVIVLGRTSAAAKARAKAPMPLEADVEIDLGDSFRLRGMGADTELAGTVRVRTGDGPAPRVNGTIRAVNGTYAAYGQKLAIERGILTFSGRYDNPSLNIRAVRRRPEGEALSETNVEAGVEIRGTANAPVAKLVATPSVPDSEKLSWLVLGHGMEGVSGNEAGLLSAAAGALLGGSGSSGGFQSRLKDSLGIDELGVSQASGLESTVVTIGKRLSSRAYLSFEQGATSASSLVRIRYKLNPRITLQFQTGTNTALDVLYSWAFD